MITMLTCFVGVRQIYLFLVSNFVSNSLLSIVISYPIGWISCALITLPTCLFFLKREEQKHAISLMAQRN